MGLDKEVPVIQAQWDQDLLSAAQTIAAYYSEHSPLSELDSSIAVVYALGATSMNQLEDAWGEAMAQPDPYAAAVAASKTLLYER